jgi:hypothetical protein
MVVLADLPGVQGRAAAPHPHYSTYGPNNVMVGKKKVRLEETFYSWSILFTTKQIATKISNN